MDTLDYAILRQLAHPTTFQWNVRLSNKEVGEAVGLDEETVRQRVRRLEAQGILARWSVAVHPELLGRRLVRIELPALAEPGRAKAFEGILAMGFVYHAFDFYGGRLAIVAFAGSGAAFDRQVQLLRALWGEPLSVAQLPVPPPTIEPTPTDWRVIRALRIDARAPFAQLAERAGVSERTARRCVERLVEGRAVWLSPIMEMERAEGLIATAVRAFFSDPAKREPVDTRLRALDGIVFFGQYPEQTQVSYGARRLAEAEELRAELSAFPGVSRVEVDIMVRRTTHDAWMDEEIDRRAKGP